MKFYTHPVTHHTLIRYKDGSSYKKSWRYLRPTLILEGDQKTWEPITSTSSSSTDSVSEISNESKRHKLFVYSSNSSSESKDKVTKSSASSAKETFDKEVFSLSSNSFQPKEGLYSEKNFW